jgi:hypothetical protein
MRVPVWLTLTVLGNFSNHCTVVAHLCCERSLGLYHLDILKARFVGILIIFNSGAVTPASLELAVSQLDGASSFCHNVAS